MIIKLKFNIFQLNKLKFPLKFVIHYFESRFLFWSSACNDLLLNAFNHHICSVVYIFSFFWSCSGAIPIKPLNLTEEFFPFVVFMAPFCNGIGYADNTSCHETPGMNLSVCLRCLVKYLYYLWISCLLYDVIYPGKVEEILAILEGCRSSYSSGSGNGFCKNISPTINFFGKNQVDLSEATKLDLKIR